MIRHDFFVRSTGDVSGPPKTRTAQCDFNMVYAYLCDSHVVAVVCIQFLQCKVVKELAIYVSDFLFFSLGHFSVLFATFWSKNLYFAEFWS